ncbi:MAG: hypothetical protein WBD40_01535 [Tepidisphaeraceae bacterium]
MKRVVRFAGVTLLVITLTLSAALGFGMGREDTRRVRAFADAVRGWQTSPDYRAVSAEYVTLGVEAMRARLCGASAGTVIMAFRSLPGLPAHLAVSETSAAHYDAFSRGEVSAYLHLASEQGIADGVAMVEQLGRRDPLTDEDVIAFLAGFKLPVPTVTDAGAIAGVRRLLDDVQPARPLLVRADVATSLRSCVEGNLATMTRAEQAAEFARFDANVRATDPQLWRSKQVSDFLAGIWAQGYGQIYLDGIDGFFRIQRVARIVFVVALIVGVWIAARRRFKPTIAAPSPDAPPQSLAAAKPG